MPVVTSMPLVLQMQVPVMTSMPPVTQTQVVTPMPTLIQMPVVTSMPRGQYAFGVSTPHDPGRRSAFGAPDIWLLISCCGCFRRGSSARWFPGVGPLVSLRPGDFSDVLSTGILNSR